MSKTNTLVVNLFGGPSSRKSTVAAGVFCLLKMHGVECELVTEFAKDLVWEERYNTLKNQQYIFAKQYHKIWRLLDKVNIIITDSPLLLSIVYKPKDCVESFTNNVIDTINTIDNLNVILTRDGEYNENGRYQNEEQAKKIDIRIKHKLIQHNMDWINVVAGYKCINDLTVIILKKLGKGNLNYYIKGKGNGKERSHIRV